MDGECVSSTLQETRDADGMNVLRNMCAEDPGRGACRDRSGEGILLFLAYVSGEAFVEYYGLQAISWIARTLAPASTAACADSDCTNEVNSVVETTRRAFWAGGKAAQTAAQEWASRHGYITMDMAKLGQFLEEFTEGFSYVHYGRSIWAAGSEIYAQAAAGEIHIFLSRTGFPLSNIWWSVEYVVLKANPNVTNFIYHFVYSDGSVIIQSP